MMRDFDKDMKKRVGNEDITVPENVHRIIEETLESLPEKEKKYNFYIVRSTLKIAACLVFVFLVFMPNVSVTYAQVLQNVPIIGEIVEVVTIRNYLYVDERHELDAEIPNVQDNENQSASALINQSVDELTNAVIDKFYDDLEVTSEQGYGAVYVDYEVVTNNERWFTLKLTINELAGSSDSYAKFYHIDRVKGEYVSLKDIINEKGFKKLEEYIITEMKHQMSEKDEIKFWIGEEDLEQEVTILCDQQNFYFNDDNAIVIVYDKYEVAPGSMGCPEIIIPYNIYHEYLK